MATTSPDGLVSPDAGDPYDLTSDMAAMQASTQAALSNRASKSGTDAAMLSATNVRTGTLWFNTTDSRLYRFNGSGWDAVAPRIEAVEEVDLSSHVRPGYSGTITARIFGGITQLSFALQANTNFGASSSVTTVANMPSGRARPVMGVYSGAIFTTSGAGFASGTARLFPNGAVAVNPSRSTETSATFGFTFIH